MRSIFGRLRAHFKKSSSSVIPEKISPTLEQIEEEEKSVSLVDYFAPTICELLLKMDQEKIEISDKIIDTISKAAPSYDARGIAQALIFLKQRNVFTPFSNVLIDSIAQANDPMKFTQMLLHLKENDIPLTVHSLQLLSQNSQHLETCVYALRTCQSAGVELTEESCNSVIEKGKEAREAAQKLITEKNPEPRACLQERAHFFVRQHIETKEPAPLPKKPSSCNSPSRPASPRSSSLSTSSVPLPTIWMLERTRTSKEPSSCSPPTPVISLSKHR